MVAKLATGSTNVRFGDVLDRGDGLPGDGVEWTYEGRSASTELNGHRLEARQLGMDACMGLIDGQEAVDRADTLAEIRDSLVTRVTF